ncbi:MAG: hypothetical protein K2H35_05545, partial [Muribaculaceae bacterium]|nr:hypothetical protein [Muribaculaceae bacterium]
QDVKTILKDSGTAIISTAYGEGEHRISDAIHNALHSPLLKRHDINTSKRLLFKFVCSRDAENPLRADEINEIRQFTANLPNSIDVKWGIGDNPELGDSVKVTILASGFDVTLRDDGSGNADGSGPIVFSADSDDKAGATRTSGATKSQMEEVYGTEKLTKQIRDAAKIKYAVLLPSQFDDHEVITLLEQTPTYNRDPRFNERLAKISQSNNSPSYRPHGNSARSDAANSGSPSSYDKISF